MEEYEVLKFDASNFFIGPLSFKNDLKTGSIIVIPALFGYNKVTVSEHDTQLFAIYENKTAVLSFSKDDRLCWTGSLSPEEKV